jgi:hypothetical protein
MVPPPVVPTQDVAPQRTNPVGPTLLGADHDVPFQMSALPISSTARHKDVAAHETSTKGFIPSMFSTDHEEPFHIRASPPSSTATQTDPDTHTIALIGPWAAVPAVSGADHAEPFHRRA